MKLRPYQDDAIVGIRKVWDSGDPNALLVLATGLGKALRADQNVLTPGGWRRIGDMRVGDLVIGSTGRPIPVVGVFPQGERELFEVEVSDGARVVCDADHLWSVRTKHDRKRGAPWRTLTLRQIQDAGIGDGAGLRWELPSVAPVEHPAAGFPFAASAGLPLDPYLLGVLLGDGGLSVKGRVLITTEPELAETLHAYIPPPAVLRWCAPAGKAGTYIVGGPAGRGRNPVLSAIRGLGLEGKTSHNKFVPDTYLFSPPNVRLSLLQGIMDADGHPREDGHVEITLASRRLADGVQALVRSLGGRAKIREKRTSWSHNGERRYGTAWRVSVALMECPFRWKAPRWKPRTKYDAARRIRDVRPAGRGEAVCIKVGADDGLFVTEGYVLTHNTVVFCSLGEILRAEGFRKILVVAHRRELVFQALDKWRRVEPMRKIGVYMGARRDVTADVICASIQSCYPDIKDDDGNVIREGRIGELPLAEIDLVIFDEAHHAISPSYMGLLEAVREKNPYALHLGVTATPKRGDNKGLGALYSDVAFAMGIQRAQHEGWLVPTPGFKVEIEVDLSDVKLNAKGDDFDDDDLGHVLDVPEVRAEFVKAWKSYAEDRPTVSFSPTVAAAENLAAAFRDAGVAAESLSGLTKKKDRARLLERYEAGEVRVLCNCAVLTEGWDAPKTACVLVARPTKSIGLLAQMVGRGTRLVGLDYDESVANGKADCAVLLCAGAGDLKLASLADLSNHLDEVVLDVEEPEEEEPEPEFDPLDFDLPEVERKVIGHRVYEIDLFDGQVHYGRIGAARVAYMGKGKSLAIVPERKAGNEWLYAIFECWYPKKGDPTPPLKFIEREVMLAEAFYIANLHAMEVGDGRLLRPNKWHQSQPATAKSLGAIRRLASWIRDLGEGLPEGLLDDLTEFSRAHASYVSSYLVARVAWSFNARAERAA